MTQVTTQFDFEAKDPNEISFTAGQKFQIIEDIDDDWCMACGQDNVKGLIPKSHLKVLDIQKYTRKTKFPPLFTLENIEKGNFGLDSILKPKKSDYGFFGISKSKDDEGVPFVVNIIQAKNVFKTENTITCSHVNVCLFQEERITGNILSIQGDSKWNFSKKTFLKEDKNSFLVNTNEKSSYNTSLIFELISFTEVEPGKVSRYSGGWG